MKLKQLAIAVLLLGSPFTSCVVRAAQDFKLGDLTVDPISVGGFFSQGYLYSSNSNFPTDDKGGTWNFREMAVNASTTIGSHLRVGAQGFAESLGKIGDDKVVLDWADLDYNIRQEIGIRLGRVKYPKGLYGEALDLDFTRPFAFLPSAVYNPILRDFSASFNGGMVYGTVQAGKSSFDYKVFFGYIPISPENGVAEFYNGGSLYGAGGITSINMEHVAGGQLTWNSPIEGLKFVYSGSYFHDLSSDGPFAAAPMFNLHTVIDHFEWNTLSAEYQRGDWTFAYEWQRSTSSGLILSAPPVLASASDSVGWDAWYFSAARRFAKKFEAGVYYSNIHTRFPGGGGGQPANYRNDLAGSIRYDLNEHVLFKIEVQSDDGLYEVFNTPRIPNPAATTKDHTTVFAIKTTLSF